MRVSSPSFHVQPRSRKLSRVKSNSPCRTPPPHTLASPSASLHCPSPSHSGFSGCGSPAYRSMTQSLRSTGSPGPSQPLPPLKAVRKSKAGASAGASISTAASSTAVEPADSAETKSVRRMSQHESQGSLASQKSQAPPMPKLPQPPESPDAFGARSPNSFAVTPQLTLLPRPQFPSFVVTKTPDVTPSVRSVSPPTSARRHSSYNPSAAAELMPVLQRLQVPTAPIAMMKRWLSSPPWQTPAARAELSKTGGHSFRCVGLFCAQRSNTTSS